jgi:hypothetical protein
VRAGAYDTHMPGQHVEELRYLVEVRVTEEMAHAGNPGIVIGGLFGICFVIHIHGSELQTGKGTAEEADTALNEENRTPRIELDENIEEGEEPAEYGEQNKDGKGDIEDSFSQEVVMALVKVFSQVNRFSFANFLFQFGFSDARGIRHKTERFN